MNNRLKPTLGLGLAFFCLMLACQNKPEPEQKQANQQNCYSYNTNRDTVQLSLKIQGAQVSGNLFYSIHEKDKNSGSVEGKLRGDTLLLNYTFKSEGSQSVRQVAFLKQGNSLVEGYADVQEKGGIVMFKRPADLKFNSIIVLQKSACEAN
ncbi:MAG: hypothetical protein JWQ28_407 [Pedobacter sp.]|jgi:hypothetical protein|nr:hypothetical protein [Pedobacter sp.]